jgi:protein-L-isoaspartate(D-aspartate) O-methyltransferase
MNSTQFAQMRQNMVDSQLRTNGVIDPWIIAAMGATAREKFLPDEKAAIAYMDRSVPLTGNRMLNPPLANGQMLQAADITPTDSILLVGTGPGYLAALLNGQGSELVAVEDDAQLAAQALKNVPGITLVEGPMQAGAPDHGPYSLILIDGAVEQLPAALLDQLAEGGRIVTGLIEGAVTRLAAGVKLGGHVALRNLADLEVAALPGFERAKEFVF